MAQAIITKTHVSAYDYNEMRRRGHVSIERRGHVSIEIKATELAQRDDEWRSVMWSENETKGATLRKALLKDIIKLIKTLYPDSKVTFSQKAGCSCGCSPGFYVKDASGDSLIPNGTTVFVEIVD